MTFVMVGALGGATVIKVAALQPLASVTVTGY